ncbi:hypothetical protein DOJK_02431 [Patescibacteria group bacterium]|jgi:uncharacterized membrane protein YqjE|nr:hypothetical protein DOJK_02431 [Patescibacteria group bacterium]
MDIENLFRYLLIFFCCLSLLTVFVLISFVVMFTYKRARTVLLTIGFIREIYYLLKAIYLSFTSKRTSAQSKTKKDSSAQTKDFIDAQFREKNK